MSELKEKIMAVLTGPQLASLATITESGRPWTRYVVITTAPDMTIRLATCRKARKVAQIALHPDVHLTCGVTDMTQMKPYLQIEGRAVLKTDTAERHALWNNMLASIFAGPDDPDYGVLVITPTRIEYNAPGSMTPEIWTA